MKPITFFLLAALTFVPGSLSAKPKKEEPPPTNQPLENKDLDKSKKLFEEGENFFKLAQYDQAILAYQEAYLLSKAPLFLLNIGQCYQNMGQTKEAIHSYEAFIREDPKSPYRAEIEGKIDDLNAYLEQKQNEVTSLPTIMLNAPPEKPLNKKLLIGASAGGAFALGLGLTLFFVYRPPRSDGGALAVELSPGAK